MITHERSWDVAIVSTFDTIEDLQAYQTHPDRVRAAAFVKERAERSAAVDFESEGAR